MTIDSEEILDIKMRVRKVSVQWGLVLGIVFHTTKTLALDESKNRANSF
jgi:thiamine phosphate synthase YjbQ (UPF0047 family)